MSKQKPTEYGTVLIVTPDAVERDNIMVILQNAGYTVQCATKDNLVQFASEYNPILIILDADFTVAPDPFQALNSLYADDDTRGIPVLLLTAAHTVFNPSVTTVKIMTKRRIPPFRKGFTAEQLVLFINRYLIAYANALEQDSIGKSVEGFLRPPLFLSTQERIIAPILQTCVNARDSAEMVYIPDGPFLMGDEDQEDNPPHQVELSGFWMYKNLVTVQQYKQFCQVTGATMPEFPKFNPNWSKNDQPITDVNWEDALTYARWAGGGLPSEAEFEKVASGPSKLKYPWGNEWDPSMVWCGKQKMDDASGTHRVGERGISPYGCTDMAGNVWQWCLDWYDFDYWLYDHGPDPQGPPTGNARVVRGGSWRYHYLDAFRTACRYYYAPSRTFIGVGFRCVVQVNNADSSR